MHRSVTILGKVGNMVWGKNRHGQTHYPLVIPINPRTQAQQANRHGFGDASKGWHKLTDSQYALWEADARHYRTHGRPVSRPARLTGFQRYMQVNAPRARQGLPLLDVPPAEAAPCPRTTHHAPRPPADLPLARPPAPPLEPIRITPILRIFPIRPLGLSDRLLALSLERLPFSFRPLAFSLQPLAFSRVPMPRRCLAGAPPLHPACSTFAPRRRLLGASVHARAGPGPPLLAFSLQPLAFAAPRRAPARPGWRADRTPTALAISPDSALK